MKKILALGVLTLLLTGCSTQKAAPPAATTTPPPRKDVSGNIIDLSYIRGTVSSITDTEISLEEGDTFALSDNLKADISVLNITVGTRVIVNYKEINGEKAAVSLEKIVG